MPITDARISRLRGFGLSEYAARAYLALLDLGDAEARDVSNLSKVPTSKIYQVLEQLHERGLVDILPEFPKRYSPVAFEAFLERRRREHEEAARVIERERPDLVSQFAVLGDVQAGDRGGLELVRGRPNVTEALSSALASAREDILLLASRALPQRAGPLRRPLDLALAAGVHVRVLLPGDAPDSPDLTLGAEVRRLAQPLADGAALLLVDGRRAVLATFVPDDESPARGKDVGASADHEGLVAALRSLAERAWAEASGVSEAQRLEGIVRRLREAALLLAAGRVRAASPAACEAIGMRERELGGYPLERLLSPVPTGGVTTQAVTLLLRDGRNVLVEASLSEMDPEGTLRLVVFRAEPRSLPVESATPDRKERADQGQTR